jgi:cation transport ATPase
MASKQPATNQIREFIIQTINTKKPETINELVNLVQQKFPLSEEELISILLDLETENKIHFTKKDSPTTTSKGTYTFSTNALWYWITVALAIATAAAVFTIPEDSYPLVYLRQGLGIIFVLFLPGYALIKTLYPSIHTSSENIDSIVRVALSIGLSIALTAIVGLVLNYTPWGIRLTPVTISLLVLTVVLATLALAREKMTKNK